MTATNIKSYSQTAASNNAASPNGFPENMAPSAVNDAARQVMAELRRWYDDMLWLDLGYTYTYVSSTSFKVSGQDVTAKYVAGKRVRAIGVSTGTIYGTVTSATFSTDTTMVVVWDTGSLSNETLAVSTAPVALGAPLPTSFIPQNIQSVDYTLIASDAGKDIYHPAADTTARTFTIPANSSVPYPVGTTITFTNEHGGGVVTIAITTDTMRLAIAGTTGSRSLAADGVATAKKMTATSWLIAGSGLT